MKKLLATYLSKSDVVLEDLDNETIKISDDIIEKVLSNIDLEFSDAYDIIDDLSDAISNDTGYCVLHFTNIDASKINEIINLKN